MKYLLAFLVLLGLAVPSYAQLPSRSIAYIGCSNTEISAMYYANLSTLYPATYPRTLLWPYSSSIYEIGGGSVEEWAVDGPGPDGRNYWQAFRAAKAFYGEPAAVWVQLCENFQLRPSDYTAVQAMFAHLQANTATRRYYVSAINTYNPYVYNPNPLQGCSKMGAATGGSEGEDDTAAWAAHAVADGLALAGPALGPLNSLGGPSPIQTGSDGCHPNPPGGQSIGAQLHNFFDGF